MKLRYRNTIEDIVAFSRHFYAGAPLLKQQARNVALNYFLMVAMLFTLLSLSQRQAGWLCFGLFVASAVGVGTYFAWGPLLIWQAGRNTRKLYQQQPDKVFLCAQELEIVGEELINLNECGEFRWKLSAIEDIVETRAHVFLRISAMRAFVLPRDSFEPEELDAFLDDLERTFEQPPQALPAPASSDAIQAQRRRPWQREVE
jgi:hypothetical protein